MKIGTAKMKMKTLPNLQSVKTTSNYEFIRF